MSSQGSTFDTMLQGDELQLPGDRLSQEVKREMPQHVITTGSQAFADVPSQGGCAATAGELPRTAARFGHCQAGWRDAAFCCCACAAGAAPPPFFLRATDRRRRP